VLTDRAVAGHAVVTEQVARHGDAARRVGLDEQAVVALVRGAFRPG
jgi:hypothetical protein